MNREKRKILTKLKNTIRTSHLSYGEIAFLESHKNLVLEYGNIELAQWANIPEEEWNSYNKQGAK